MKKFSTLSVFVAILSLFATGQLFAEEQDDLNVATTEESNTEEVKEVPARKAKERDYDFYVSVGGSRFREDIDSAIGIGNSFRYTFGYQFRKWFGFEMFEERTPALETKSILANLRQSLDEQILDYSISTRRNWFGGYLAKFSYELNKSYALVAKVGVAKYEAHRITARLTLADEADHLLYDYRDLDRTVEGYTPILSLGVEIPFPYTDSEKTSGEAMLVQMTDKSVKSLSMRVAFKYTF